MPILELPSGNPVWVAVILAFESLSAASQDVQQQEAGSELQKLGLRPDTLIRDVGVPVTENPSLFSVFFYYKVDDL